MNGDLILQDGAILIADAHYNSNRKCFLYFVEYLDNLETPPPQIFLMGDMFDLLVGQVTQTKIFNSSVVKHINSLSQKSEIFYFEGNHDFNISIIFENVKVFSMKNQPVKMSLNNKTVLLSHGDYKVGGSYAIYSAIIRNPLLLKFLNFFDEVVSSAITNFIIKKHLNKKLCRNFTGFKEYVKDNLDTDVDYYIEGHYHQDKQFKFDSTNYINLSAFACNQSYVEVDFQNRNNLFNKVKFKDHRCKPMMKH